MVNRIVSIFAERRATLFGDTANFGVRRQTKCDGALDFRAQRLDAAFPCSFRLPLCSSVSSVVKCSMTNGK